MALSRHDINIILAAVSVSTLVVISMFIYAIVSAPKPESFSTLGVVGPSGYASDYPTQVSPGEQFTLGVTVENHENRIEYYVVKVKIGDIRTEHSEKKAADLPTEKEYEKILRNGESWEFYVHLTINKRGRNYKVIFELWIYNEKSSRIEYTGNFAYIWTDAV